ncbi:MAG: host attachment protein [Pseudomonadota bacterium]|nr:host attachment protein [Pseudomonadota bacterium]
MRIPSNAHVAIVDGENFTVMRNGGAPLEPKLDRAEQPDLSATNYSAGVRHQDNIGREKGTSTQLDELAHAAAAAEWLNSQCGSGDIADLLVIADPKTLGEMRHHYHSELEKRLVGEIAKTMTGQPTDKIEQAIASA